MAIFKDLLNERVAESEAFDSRNFSRHHCNGPYRDHFVQKILQNLLQL